MNTQEYISSGIVEAYVLGLASPEEMTEFEQACEQYPAVLEARNAFELALEKQARENAIAPPVSLKEEIRAAIGTPASRVITMNNTAAGKTNWFKYAAAACVLLLAGSLYWNISLYNKNQQLNADTETAKGQLASVENEIAIIRSNPTMKVAAMKGMPESPTSFATVYWDTTTHDVYLLINNLPAAPSDKQYQLWAIFNGKPVDLGVFDFKKDKLLIQGKNAQGAEAFAITLEERGGSPTPKGKMYVKGDL